MGDILFWNAIGAIGSILSILGVLGTIVMNGRLARKRATLDLVMHEADDKELQEAAEHINNLAKDIATPVCLFAFNRKKETILQKSSLILPSNCCIFKNENIINNMDEIEIGKTRKKILKLLNTREFVAIGIHQNVLSEKIYKETNCSIYIRDWKNLSGFVSELRREKNSDTIFQDFERLAKKWKKHPLKNRN